MTKQMQRNVRHFSPPHLAWPGMAAGTDRGASPPCPGSSCGPPPSLHSAELLVGWLLHFFALGFPDLKITRTELTLMDAFDPLFFFPFSLLSNSCYILFYFLMGATDIGQSRPIYISLSSQAFLTL